jgi:threonine aldolase
MDAFTVFNRIQEAVVRGNAFVRSLTKVNTSYGGLMRKARPISSVSEGIRVNSELWAIADAYSGTAVEEVAPHGWAVAETAVA